MSRYNTLYTQFLIPDPEKVPNLIREKNAPSEESASFSRWYREGGVNPFFCFMSFSLFEFFWEFPLLAWDK